MTQDLRRLSLNSVPGLQAQHIQLSGTEAFRLIASPWDGEGVRAARAAKEATMARTTRTAMSCLSLASSVGVAMCLGRGPMHAQEHISGSLCRAVCPSWLFPTVNPQHTEASFGATWAAASIPGITSCLALFCEVSCLRTTWWKRIESLRSSSQQLLQLQAHGRVSLLITAFDA